ncbi:MAG: helix-turn-helix transcriptional regulator [Coprobacillus sp.]
MMTTTQLLNILKQNKNISLNELLKEIPDLSFVDYLETLLEQCALSKGDLIARTSLDRTYAYQIMNGTKNPSQDKVVQIALALSLNLHDTNVLLTLSKNESLYPKVKRDALIIFCINKHYTVMQTNQLLDEYHYDILN